MEIVKAFQNNELSMQITIRGSREEPLFRASDIGEVLEMTNIRQSIKDFDTTEKHGVSITDIIGREQETTFLTEKGLYQVLFTSRKPIAKKFKNWVCEVIKEIRLNGKYSLEKQLKDKDQEIEDTLLNSFDNKQVLYLIQVKEYVIKFGHTNDIKRRYKEHRTKYGPQILIKMLFETKYNRELEQMIKLCLKEHIIDIDSSLTELIQLTPDFTYEDLKKEMEILKEKANNNIIPHLINKAINESTKKLTKKIAELTKKLAVYETDIPVVKTQELNQILVENRKEIETLRKITNNRSIITPEQLKHIPIEESVYKEFIQNRLIIEPGYRCALTQLCKDFHQWSGNDNIFINNRYKVKFKEELMKNITKSTGIKEISGMNITDKSKGINLTRCIGFEGIGIKEVETNNICMYENNIYREFLSEKIIVTNIPKDKLTIKETLDNFMTWMTSKNYKINKESMGKSLYSEIFMAEFVKFATDALNIQYNLKGRKKYNGVKCSGYFIGIKKI